MSRQERRERRELRRVLRRTPEGRRLAYRRLVTRFAAISLFLVAVWAFAGGGDFWPAWPMMGMGLAAVIKGLRLREEAGGPPVAEPIAESGLRGRVGALAERLRARGQARLAEALGRGLAEVEALARSRAELDVGGLLVEARAEGERLGRKALEARDPEARAAWEKSAETARRRVEKLEGLAAEHDRTDARTEAFTQLVKSLELDVARMDDRPDAGDGALAELETQAARVEGEVDALHRAREELARLGSVARQRA